MSKSNQPPLRDPRWEQICLDYLDGNLDIASPELQPLLQSPEFCRLLAALAIDQIELQALAPALQPDTADLPQRMRSLSDQPTAPAPLAAPATRTQGSAAANQSLSHRLAVSLFAATGVAAALLIGATLWLWPQANRPQHGGGALPRTAPEVVQLLSWSGQVKVDGTLLQPDRLQQSWLHAGSTIVTDGGSGVAVLRFADGSTIVVASDSAVTVDLRNEQKFVDVVSGYISAAVEPQPAGKPLTINTAEAVVEVVGTELAISRLPSATTLSVTGGKVRMRRNADGQLVEVQSGEYAVAADRSHKAFSQDYRAYELGACPSQWTENFETGLPPNWRSGRWTSDGLPAGSTGGVIADQQSPGDDYCVCTNVNEEIWKRGLVEVHEDSVLNIRMKIEGDQFYHVLLFMRGQMHYEYQEPRVTRGEWQGKWRTLRIPLSAFKRTSREFALGDDFETRAHVPPHLKRPIYMLLVSSQKQDIGLTIDKIWITRDSDLTTPSSVEVDK